MAENGYMRGIINIIIGVVFIILSLTGNAHDANHPIKWWVIGLIFIVLGFFRLARQ